MIVLLVSCNPSSGPEKEQKKNIEQTGLFLDSMPQIAIKAENRKFLEDELEDARTNYFEDSTDLNTIIWYGRRLAYLHRYEEAVIEFSKGIKHHPGAPELYRHRGHRMITLRRLQNAISDLGKASHLVANRPFEIEPDGLPNKLGIPLSNLHFNIYYHLGIAHYLSADYTKAIESLKSSMEYAKNDDLIVATTYWLVLACLRDDMQDEVGNMLTVIHPDMEIIENLGYLDQLLFFKGISSGDALWDLSDSSDINPTSLYGISVWNDYSGRKGEAAAIRKHILAANNWTYFGYIAAEADSLRLRSIN